MSKKHFDYLMNVKTQEEALGSSMNLEVGEIEYSWVTLNIQNTCSFLGMSFEEGHYA